MNEQTKDFDEMRAEALAALGEFGSKLELEYGIPFILVWPLLKAIIEGFELTGSPTDREGHKVVADTITCELAAEEVLAEAAGDAMRDEVEL